MRNLIKYSINTLYFIKILTRKSIQLAIANCLNYYNSQNFNISTKSLERRSKKTEYSKRKKAEKTKSPACARDFCCLAAGGRRKKPDLVTVGNGSFLLFAMLAVYVNYGVLEF